MTITPFSLLLSIYFLQHLFTVVDAGSPLVIQGPCQDGLFYYQHYAVYRCVDGHKMFQNCVPLNEPHSTAIAINSTLISPHFRSICVQYAPDSVQFIRTHCVEGTRFMKPNSNLDFPNRRVECIFDPSIQTLRKVIIRKRVRRVCRHKKDTKIEANVHYICKQNAYWPDYCVVANATDGTEIQIKLGAQQSDGLNYVFECKLIKSASTNSTTISSSSKSKKRKGLPNNAMLGPIRCLHYFNSSSLPKVIEIGHHLEFPEGNVIIHCFNNSGWARKIIIPQVPQVSVDCLLPFGTNLYSCRGLVYSWSLISQIQLIGCVDPLNLLNWIPLGKNLTTHDHDIFTCKKEGLVFIGCKSSSGKLLKIGESEGNPAGEGGNGLFERCEESIGIIKYHEAHCQYGDIIVLPGHFFIVQIHGANLKLRLLCEQRRLYLGNDLADNLNHRAFWFVLVHRDCVDNFGSVVQLGGFSFYKNKQNVVTTESCLLNQIQINKPNNCKFGTTNLYPTDYIINSHDKFECLPNGLMRKIGCYFESSNITMDLGQIEYLPNSNQNLLINCEINSTGILFTNGVKNCIKEETGEEFQFGSKDENSDSIRICTRKTEPELHGVWELTHCIFGTIKIPRGSCFFNQTYDNEENNSTINLCNSKKSPKGIYKLCEQDINSSKPIFLDASYEYCSPRQNVKATDHSGQLLNSYIENFDKKNFECNSDWKPKPLPIELENTSKEEDDDINEYIDDEYSDEDEEKELKTAEIFEDKEDQFLNKKQTKKLSSLIYQKEMLEEGGGIKLKDPTLKEIKITKQMDLEAPPQQILMSKDKIENLTTTTTEATTSTTEANKLENIETTEGLTSTTTTQINQQIDELILLEEEENNLIETTEKPPLFTSPEQTTTIPIPSINQLNFDDKKEDTEKDEMITVTNSTEQTILNNSSTTSTQTSITKNDSNNILYKGLYQKIISKQQQQEGQAGQKNSNKKRQQFVLSNYVLKLVVFVYL